MSFTLTDAERKALGLQTATFGEEQFVEVAPDVAGYGRAQVAQVATIAALVATSHFSTPQVDAAQRSGMRVSTCDEQPAVIRVVDESGATLEARGSATSGDWIEPDKEDPGTVFLDLSAAEVVSVHRPDGSGLVLRPGPHGFTVVGFHPPISEIASRLTARAPIESWCKECDDPWLVDEMKRRGEFDDGWQHAVAAGVFARLETPPQQPARYVERLLAGGAAPSEAPPRSWARELTAEQAKGLTDFALVVADRMREILVDLHERMTPGEESWASSFHAVCLKRDDLEGVRLLLIERGPAERATKALDRLDQAGRVLVTSIPRVLTLNDERLYRTRLADPDAWWALFAEPEQEG